jgi:hypothetical protein
VTLTLRRDADSERLITLFRVGFELDEHVDERLADLKRTGVAPTEALPGLREVIGESWSKAAFADWLAGHGDVRTTLSSITGGTHPCRSSS